MINYSRARYLHNKGDYSFFHTYTQTNSQQIFSLSFSLVRLQMKADLWQLTLSRSPLWTKMSSTTGLALHFGQ